MRAWDADFRGVFVLLTGLSPSHYDNLLALVLNPDADKSQCSCETSGFLGNSFGHCTTSECALYDFSLHLNLCQADSEDVQCLLCVSVARHCTFVCIPQFSAILHLCCCTTKRQKGWNRLIGHGTHMAGISIGQVTEHHVSPDAAKATPKFSPTRHDSLVCMKKINIFLLASVLLLCICLAGFSSVRLAHLYLLPTCANFRRISAFTWLLSVPVLVPSLVSCAI